MKIIAFTGMPCSGKSVAVQMAKEKGIPVVRMGDQVWDETKRQGLELTDKNVGTVADTMRKKYGKDIWARRTVELFKQQKASKTIVIDGVRNREEVELFRKTLGDDFIVIAITASDEIRRRRVLARGRVDDSQKLADIMERDSREKSWGLDAVIASADVVVSNEGSLEKFEEDITALLQELVSKAE